MEERSDLNQPLLSGLRRRRGNARRVNPLVQIQTELRPIFAKNDKQVLFAQNPTAHQAKKDALYNKLKDIEALSVSDIRRIVNMPVSYVNHKASDSAYFIFCEISHWLSESEYPKTLQVLADHAFRLLRLGRFMFRGNSVELPSTILFFGIDQLLTAYPTFGRFRRWRFNSPNNLVVNKVLERIARELLDPRNNDAIEYKKGLWERLNKFTPGAIKRCLTQEIQTENQGKLTLFNTFQAIDFSQYPHIKTAIDEIKTAKFDKALESKKLQAFASEVDSINGQVGEVEQLQILISRLVERIGTSRFQGKYEDMMELCLVRLMELSDPHEGLDLDPAVLGKCLKIIDNYYLHRNRAKFFTHVRLDEYTMLAYVRRAVPSFENYPNLQLLVPNHEGITPVAVNTLNDDELIARVKLGEIDPQKLLARTVKDERFNQTLAARLVTLCGADLDSPDMFSRHHRKDGDLPCENFLFMALQARELGEPWEFYLSCKAQQEKSVNDVLSTVIEFYINCVQWKFGTSVLLGGCHSAIKQLLRNPNVVVTEAMLDKFNVLPNGIDEGGVRKKLQKKMGVTVEGSRPVEGKGKDEAEKPAAAASPAPAFDDLRSRFDQTQHMLNVNQGRLDENKQTLEEHQQTLDEHQRRIETLGVAVKTIEPDQATSHTTAAQVRQVAEVEAAHPVHARRNSAGAAAPTSTADVGLNASKSSVAPK